MGNEKLGQVTFAQLKILMQIIFTSQKRFIYLMLLGQLCIVLLQEIVGYLIGLIPSHFYLILGAGVDHRSHSQFNVLAVYAAVVMLVISFIKASKMLVTGFLFISWRDVLTKSLHSRYFATSHSVYKANEQNSTKDNPDQRIASDASAVCSDLSQCVPVVLISPFTITYYTYKCWQITSYVGPVTVISFFLVATVINKLLMDRVAKWTYMQERFEGDFRYVHMLIRNNCEPSAFYHLNELEEKQTNESLTSLLAVQERLMYSKYMQNMFISLCDYIASILSYIMLSIPIFSGQYDDLTGSELSSLISQYSYQSMYLFNCFTTLIDLSKQAATLFGNSQRVADFIQALDIMNAEGKGDGDCGGAVACDLTGDDGAGDLRSDRLQLINVERRLDATDLEPAIQHSYQVHSWDSNIRAGESIVTMESVSIKIPAAERVLLSNFTHNFKQGVNTLITGPSGVGKSSLLRVIGRLWSPYRGHVTIRGGVGVSCCTISILPQKPYFLTGLSSLADQIYLGTPLHSDHTEIIDLLGKLGLSELIHRYGDITTQITSSWYDVLTPGEAQRLSIVRALYHKPLLLFLDEGTSQVDPNNERKIYELLRDRNITFVSVGHRQSIREYHSLEISINADTTYSVSTIANRVNPD